MYFENEVRPVVLQPGVQQTQSARIHATRTEWTHYQLQMVCAFGFLAVRVFVERWTGALQARSHFQTALTV